jgi:5-oxoprolinase (ATP-hydrolysing)
VDGKPAAVASPFYQRDELASGQRVEGPAVIQQFESTVVVPPGGSLVVNSHGVLVADLNEGRSS